MQHGTRTGCGLGLDSVLVQHCSEEIHYIAALSGRLSFKSRCYDGQGSAVDDCQPSNLFSSVLWCNFRTHCFCPLLSVCVGVSHSTETRSSGYIQLLLANSEICFRMSITYLWKGKQASFVLESHVIRTLWVTVELIWKISDDTQLYFL